MGSEKRLVKIVLLCLFFTFSQAKGSDWEWGKEILPTVSQSAIGGAYKKCELKKLPLEEVDIEEGGSQLKFIALKVPPIRNPAITTVVRGHTEVNFRLNKVCSFADILNHSLNRSIVSNFADGIKDSIILPLDINDPSHRGHGIIFSIFRNVTPDSSGMFSAKVLAGTGYLVSPSCIVTAAHNVVLESFTRTSSSCEDLSPYAESVEFWPLMNGLTPDMFDKDGDLKNGGVRAVSVKLHPKWDPQGLSYQSYDIAVVKLSQAIGREYGCCATRELTDIGENEIEVSVSGYPMEGEASFILAKCSGRIVSANKTKIFYFIDPPTTKKGHSGSGVRLSAVDGAIIIGTHTTAAAESSAAGRVKGGGICYNNYYNPLVGKWVKEFEEAGEVVSQD